MAIRVLDNRSRIREASGDRLTTAALAADDTGDVERASERHFVGPALDQSR